MMKQTDILTLLNLRFNKRSFFSSFHVALLLLVFCLNMSDVGINSQANRSPFDGTLRRIHVPILMYHYVSPLPEDADEYRQNLTISPERFREHLQYFSENNYETVSLYQLDNALNSGAPLPEMPIILTFDDGYIDHYEYVLPLLSEFDFTGTFFVITDRLDNNDPQYIDWQQAQIMKTAGMSIESHTKSHPDLRGRDYDFLIFQVLGSIESITVNIQQSTHMFSYPSGRYDSVTLDVLNTMPIWRAVTTRSGALHTSDNRLEVTRLRISGDMGVAGLRQLLMASTP
ncbi:MAG: polysaccharide deacetylase family protein [Aggregatilineales bacterium]